MGTPAQTARSALFGLPLNNATQPSRMGMLRAIEELTVENQALASGAICRSTRAALNATLAAPLHQMAWVTGDPVPANKGIYENTGTTTAAVWTWRRELPDFHVQLVNTGAGTGNAIQAASDLPIPAAAGRALVSLNIIAANASGAVTLAANGAAAIPVVTASGSVPPANGLLPGMIVLGFFDGINFRIVSDIASAAIVAQAEASATAAAAYAVAAAAALASVTPVAVPADIGGVTLALSTPSILVLNQYSDTQLAPAEWVPTVGNVEPTHAMKQLTANGVWMELSAVRGVGEFDPRHFGSVPHNGDASVAFGKMMDLMLWKGGGKAMLPAGSYYIEAGLGRSFSTGLANEYTIEGAGKYATRLIFDGPSFTGSSNHLLGFRALNLGINSRGDARRFSMLCDGVIDGEVLDFSKPRGGIGPESTVTFSEVSIRGLNFNGNHFKRGFNASGQFFMHVDKCEFAGNSYLGGAAVPYDDSHPWYQADNGFNFNDTYGGDITNNVARYCKRPYTNTWPDNHTGATGEGIVMINNRAGNCLTGYTYKRPSPEPANRWINNYADARDCGYLFQCSFGFSLTSNEVYVYSGSAVANLSTSPVDSNTPVDFYLAGCYDVEIIATRHRGSDIRKAAYVFMPWTNVTTSVVTNPREIRVREPIFEGWTGHSLYRAFAGSTNGRIIKPKICANSNITNMAFGNHSVAEWGLDHEDMAKVVLGLSAPQSINSATVTYIAWTSEDQDDYNAHAANSAEIIVPANKGIRSFRAIFQGSYNAGGFTGYRQFELHRNDVLMPNGFSDVQAASQPHRIGRSTEWISCTAGQVLKVMTQQNSGSAQDLANGQTTLTIIWSGEKGI